MAEQNTSGTNIQNLEEEIQLLKQQLAEQKGMAVEEKTIQTEVLYKWTSPSRIFVKRDQRWFVSIAFVILVFIILFAFLQDILPIFVLVALMFLVYLLGTVEPDNVTHEVTNKGIQTMDKLFEWKALKNFWFARQGEWIKVNVDTNLTFPARLVMLVKDDDQMAVFNMIKDHLKYEEIERQQWLSRLTDGEYIPLETYLPKTDVAQVAEEVSAPSENI